MRLSQLLTTTLREVPRDTEGGNQELLVRGGYIRQLTSGIYSMLPLGNRVIRKISQIIREEMDRAGGQEVTMPVLQPKDLWDKEPVGGGPSRSEAMGDVLFKLKDRKGRDMVLGPTHEEVVTLLVKEFARSYRDLPQLIYQIQTKLRDEPRPRGGLLRVREFIMKDLYSFDADYAANREKAEFVRSELVKEPVGELEEVYTPNCTSISDLASFLNVPEAKTIKSVCYVAGDKLVLAVVRGDLEINEVKLANMLYH